MLTKQAPCIYEFGPFRLDATKRLLLREGEMVLLTPKCFDILLALIGSEGKVISKEELMKRVWPDSFVEDGNLTYNISVLRKALGERAGAHQYIVTLPGRGYQFVATVSPMWLDNPEAPVLAHPEFSEVEESKETLREPLQSKTEQQETTVLNRVEPDDGQPADHLSARNRASENTPPRFHWQKLMVLAVALTIAGLISVGGYLRFGRSEPRQPIRMVAVLPLVNGSADPDMEYLSEGISESLINNLSQLPGVKVIARNSSFKYKGKAADPQEVARALGVEALVTGRVSLRGEQLQISVELMDAREGTQMWGKQYNRPAIDLLALQSEISGEIADKLRFKLTNAEQQQLAKRETVNSEAYEMILRGRYQREKGGPENLKSAAEFFKRAIAIDPSYALAHAELSIIYGLLSASNLLDPKEYLPQAEAEARQALALDANLADAHYAMANAEMNKLNWPAAAAAFDRALTLNPSLARARWRHALYLSTMGQHDQAIAEIERARELNPLSPRFKAYVSIMFLEAGRKDEAIKVLQNTLALDPNSREAQTGLGYAYLAKGMYAESITAYQMAIKSGYAGSSTQIYLGAAYAKGGERNKALAILKRLQTSNEYVSPCELAVLHVALGQREEAFASLERAYTEHDLQLGGLGNEPGFDPIRSDPRFQNLMQRVGLPQ